MYMYNCVCIYCFYMTDNRTIIISNEVENSETDSYKDSYDNEVIDVPIESSIIKYNKVK